jgi:hypothetical protein
MFPQFLTSITLRFPLDEVLRVFGYSSATTKVQVTPMDGTASSSSKSKRPRAVVSRFLARRRAREDAAVRAMMKYRANTRGKKQKRRWIPFVLKWKKTINIVLALCVVWFNLFTYDACSHSLTH